MIKQWKFVLLCMGALTNTVYADTIQMGTIQMGYKVFGRTLYLADVIVTYSTDKSPAKITMQSESRGLLALFKSGAFDFSYTPDGQTIQLVFSDSYKRFQYLYDRTHKIPPHNIPKVKSLKYDFSEDQDPLEVEQEIWRGDSFFGVLYDIMQMPKMNFTAGNCPKSLQNLKHHLFTTRSTYQMNITDTPVVLDRPLDAKNGEIPMNHLFACNWNVKHIRGSDKYVDAFDNGETWFGVIDGWDGIIPTYHYGDGEKGSAKLVMVGVAINGKTVMGELPKLAWGDNDPEYWQRLRDMADKPYDKIPEINLEKSKK